MARVTAHAAWLSTQRHLDTQINPVCDHWTDMVEGEMNESDSIDPDAPGEARAPTADGGPEREAGSKHRERVIVGTGLFWGLVVGLVLAVVIIILAAQNTQEVAITFLVWDYSTPLIVVILAVLLVGVILDELAGLIYRRRRRRTLTDRQELERLRTRGR